MKTVVCLFVISDNMEVSDHTEEGEIITLVPCVSSQVQQITCQKGGGVCVCGGGGGGGGG